MWTKKILISMFVIAIVINILWLWAFYLYLDQGNYLESLASKYIPGLTKVINKKYVEEKVQEYVKLTDLQNDIVTAIDKASPSVVSIVISRDLKVYYEDPFNFFGWYVTQQEEKIWGWSWIIVASEWYIITNKHVVQDPNNQYSVITRQWDTYKVDKVWLDPVLDIAVLKIVNEDWSMPSSLVAADIASINNDVKIWQFVIAIWNALAEYKDTATFGIISGKGRQLNQQANDSVYIWLYQTDTAINPGNSWGPLLDINGSVIWVNTAISANWQWIGFSLPLNKEFVQNTLAMIIKDGKITRPFVGVWYTELNKSTAKNLWIEKFSWVYVSEVVTGSVAQSAGIKKGDIILEIDGNKVDSENSFIYRLYTYKPNDTAELLLYSNKDYKKVQLQLWSLK